MSHFIPFVLVGESCNMSAEGRAVSGTTCTVCLLADIAVLLTPERILARDIGLACVTLLAAWPIPSKHCGYCN